MDIFEQIEYMASRGFIAEVVQDSAVEFEFVKSKADYNTGKPTGFGVAWRGCYAFFDKKGKYNWDDVGCFGVENGGAKRAFDELIKTFEHLIKMGWIDESALKDEDCKHHYMSVGTAEYNVIIVPTKGEEYITKGSDSLSAGFKTHTFIGILKGIEEFYPGNGKPNPSFNELSLNGIPIKEACGYAEHMWEPQHLYITSLNKPEIGDWYLQGDADGGGEQIFGIKQYTGGEQPYGYAVVVATTNKSLKLPLIPVPFLKEYVKEKGNIKKVNIRTGKRNVQAGDSTMGEFETITEPFIKYGYITIL